MFFVLSADILTDVDWQGMSFRSYVSMAFSFQYVVKVKGTRFGWVFFNVEEESEDWAAKTEHQTFMACHLFPQCPFNIAPQKLQRHGAPSSPPMWCQSLNSLPPIGIWKRRCLKVDDQVEYIAIRLALGCQHAQEVLQRKGNLGPLRERSRGEGWVIQWCSVLTGWGSSSACSLAGMWLRSRRVCRGELFTLPNLFLPDSYWILLGLQQTLYWLITI